MATASVASLETRVNRPSDLGPYRDAALPLAEFKTRRQVLGLSEDNHWAVQPLLVHDKGHYLLLNQAGRGMHGRVFKAYSLRTNELVALKFDAPTPRGLEFRRMRKQDEEDVMDAEGGKVTYIDGVLPRYDRKLSDGTMFYEMSFMDTWLDSRYAPNGERKHWRNGIGKNDLYRHITQMLDIAASINEQWGITYRDYKLSNFALAGKGRLVLSDFGLSSSGHTQSPRDNLGWIYHRPPENFRSGADAGIKYDSWNLGSLIFRMCKGTVPLEEELDRCAKMDGVNDLNKSERIQQYLRTLTVAEGNKIICNKLGRSNWYGYQDVPSEVQVILKGMLHWDPEQRLSCAQAKILWEQTLKRSEVRSTYTKRAGAMLGLASAITAAGLAFWPGAQVTPAELEELNTIKKEKVLHQAAPMIENRHTKEGFIGMLKRSYDYANNLYYDRRKGGLVPANPDIRQAFSSRQLKLFYDQYARQEAQEEEGRKNGSYIRIDDHTKYERIRNHVVNAAVDHVDNVNPGIDFYLNKDHFMLAALLGEKEYDSLVAARGFNAVSAQLEKNPGLLLNKRDAEFLRTWRMTFYTIRPFNEGERWMYSRDLRYR